MQTRSTQLKLSWEKYHLGEDEEVEEEAGVDEVEEPALDRREEYGNVTFVYVHIHGVMFSAPPKKKKYFPYLRSFIY